MTRRTPSPEPSAPLDRAGLGAWGETLVAATLRARGYRILAANLEVDGVELDLVARKRRRLLVVEVKTARAPRWPETQLSAAQLRRLHRAAARIPAAIGLRRLRAEVVLAAVTVPRTGDAEVRFFDLPPAPPAGRGPRREDDTQCGPIA